MNLTPWSEFKKMLGTNKNIRTARSKVRRKVWPGVVDDDEDVWIDAHAFFFGKRDKSAEDICREVMG